MDSAKYTKIHKWKTVGHKITNESENNEIVHGRDKNTLQYCKYMENFKIINKVNKQCLFNNLFLVQSKTFSLVSLLSALFKIPKILTKTKILKMIKSQIKYLIS